MGCLVGGDAVVHLSEFFFDEGQTSVDEVCAAAGHLVLFVDPVLIEGINDGGQYLLGLFRGVVGILDIENSGLLVITRDYETATDALRYSGNFAAVIVEIHAAYNVRQQEE